MLKNLRRLVSLLILAEFGLILPISGQPRLANSEMAKSVIPDKAWPENEKGLVSACEISNHFTDVRPQVAEK